jgi:hypothetical protein
MGTQDCADGDSVLKKLPKTNAVPFVCSGERGRVGHASAKFVASATR